MATAVNGRPTSVSLSGTEEELTLPSGAEFIIVTDLSADAKIYHVSGGTGATLPSGSTPITWPVKGQGYTSLTGSGTCVVTAVL